MGDLTMKSEIEFRGQRAGNKEWVYGYYGRSKIASPSAMFLGKGDVFIEKSFIFNELLAEEVIPETVGQYVGIADKNGKKIFEHDIVKTKYGRLCRVVRVSLPSYVGWDLEVFDENNALTTKKPDEYDLYYKDNLEVIGTVFDKESDNGD